MGSSKNPLFSSQEERYEPEEEKEAEEKKK
jgi:hypothetical protein